MPISLVCANALKHSSPADIATIKDLMLIRVELNISPSIQE
jgi:hypothetical protein